MIFSDYLRVIVKRKWTVLLAAALVAASTYGWASKQKPTYRSLTRIKIQRIQTFADFFDEIMVSSTDPLDNYVHEIESEKVLSRAVVTLNADGDPCDVAALRKSISTTRVEHTDLIDVTSEGASPEQAHNRGKAVVDAFIRHHDESITKNASDVSKAIERIRAERMESLKAEEEELRNRLGDHAFVDRDFDQLKLLRQSLLEEKIRLLTLREEGNYTEEYPEIVASRNKIEIIDQQIKGISARDREIQGMMREYEKRRKIVDEMDNFFTKRLEEARIAETRKGERVDIIEPTGKGERVTTATAYLLAVGLLLGLMFGIVLAFIAENLDTSIRTLVEIEETFHLPILGIIPHFSPHGAEIPIRPEGLWDRIKYSELVNSAAIFWRALLSAGSRRRKAGRASATESTMLIMPTSPRSPATEGYRAIRTYLQLNARHEKIGAVLVASSGPAEGKSTTAANLAFAFAQAGKKTLLVGANMRRPSLYKTFGLDRERGLAEILVSEISWREAVKDNNDLAIGDKTEENLATVPGAENVFFITCGGRTIQPAEWLSLPVFEATVKEWEAEFDVVLIDGTPILPVPDSVIMSAVVRHVILVFQAGVTQRDSMLRAISLVQKAGAEISGLVLNDLRASWSASPDYFHYRGYYGRPEK